MDRSMNSTTKNPNRTKGNAMAAKIDLSPPCVGHGAHTPYCSKYLDHCGKKTGDEKVVDLRIPPADKLHEPQDPILQAQRSPVVACCTKQTPVPNSAAGPGILQARQARPLDGARIVLQTVRPSSSPKPAPCGKRIRTRELHGRTCH